MLGKNCPLSDKYKLWVTLHNDCLVDVRKSTEENSAWNCNCSGCEVYEEKQRKQQQMWEANMSASPYSHQHTVEEFRNRPLLDAHEYRRWVEVLKEREMYERRKYEEEMMMKGKWFYQNEEEKI